MEVWNQKHKYINARVSYKNVAFPLMFKMLDKRGNSVMSEQIELIKQYVEWFGKKTIDCLWADREFVGDKWMEFLFRGLKSSDFNMEDTHVIDLERL